MPSSRSNERPQDCGCQAAARGTFLGWVGQLVHDHRAELARVARQEGLPPEDAFDAVQDAFQTFLTLPAARSLVDAREDSRRLLVTLTRNVARNRRRRHERARPHDADAALALAADGPAVDEAIDAAEQRLRLEGCVASLAEVQRAVVTLRMLDEVAGDDVAGALGITPGHVAVLLHRAKANLLDCMTADSNDGGVR